MAVSLARREFLFQHIANRRARRSLRRGTVLRDLLALLLFHGALVTESDAARFRADLDDLEIVFFARLEWTSALQRTAGRAIHTARVVATAALHDFDEGPEFQDVADLARDDRGHGILFRSQKPRIGQRLLHAQRNATIARLDVKNHNVDFVASLYQLRRIHGLLRPAHFGRVHQAFDAGFEFDERAVIDNANDLAFELATSWIFLRGANPGIRRELFQPQRDALLFLVELQNDDVEFLVRLYDVGRML